MFIEMYKHDHIFNMLKMYFFYKFISFVLLTTEVEKMGNGMLKKFVCVCVCVWRFIYPCEDQM